MTVIPGLIICFGLFSSGVSILSLVRLHLRNQVKINALIKSHGEVLDILKNHNRALQHLLEEKP